MNEKYEIIKDIILHTIPGTDEYYSPIDGVRLVRKTHTTPFLKCLYSPICVFALQGTKHMLYGEKNFTYSKGQYLISCTDIPVASKIVEATPTTPYVVLLLELDSTIISDLILETQPAHPTAIGQQCLAIADTDENLLDAFYRLARLIENPSDTILSAMILREIYYRLLTGPLGNQLRLIHTKGTPSNQIAQAIQVLKEKYTEKLNMDTLAESINMSPASFYRNFKKITKITPLQYQKQLRLHEARRLMLSHEYDATTVSYKVGYESPTQFSREYKKLFGIPPKASIRTLIQP